MSKCNKTIRALALLFIVYQELAVADAGNSAESLSQAISEGTPLIQFRTRFENVQQDGKVENANAWTLRSIIGWQTLPLHDFSVTAQLINVTQFNNSFYDNDKGLGFASSYPTVQDPEITDINQMYLRYDGLSDTSIKVGRQLVILDNVRFIGNVDFRQTPQIFDGFSVTNKTLPNVEFYAAHFDRLRQTTTRVLDTNLEILHADYRLSPTEHLIGYGYFQDQPFTGQKTGFTDNSNRTLGLRLNGTHMLHSPWKLLYTAEYAKQDHYDNGDRRIDAYYLRSGIGLDWNGWYARIDRELLSSNNGLYGFQTPLATLHLFQGWADMLTTTPMQGLEDKYLSVGGRWEGISFSSELHRFNSDTQFVTPGGSGHHYGSEFDVSAAYNITKKLMCKLEFANFKEGAIYSRQRKPDTEKTWVTLIYQY